jgi:uncharacterized protein
MLFAAAVPPVLQALDRAGALLAGIVATDAPDAVLGARLVPGMFGAAGQLRTVTNFALRATFPLTGKPIPRGDFRDDACGLQGRIIFARAEIEGLQPGDFTGAETRVIRHRAGEADLEQAGAEYLHLFALPNLWFHLSMAYAICRQQGMDIGKADFDGWHSYPAGFRFPGQGEGT